jgi:hypothetical protein
MELLWESLYSFLTSDSILLLMTGHTSEYEMIKRGNSASEIPFSGTRTRAICFQEWTDVRINKSATSNIRDITFLFCCFGKQNDKEVCSLKDYLIILLDGANLTNVNVKNFYTQYDDFSSPPYFEKAEHVWRIDLRFRCTVKLL